MLTNNYTAVLEDQKIDKSGYFTAYASVFNNIDSQNDMITYGAFDHTLKKWNALKKMPPLLWQHNMEHPIGCLESIITDPRGLYVTGKIILGLQKGKEAYILMKSGIITDLSIGYFTIVASPQKKGKVRKIYQVDLFEISLVTIGANPKACLESVKYRF